MLRRVVLGVLRQLQLLEEDVSSEAPQGHQAGDITMCSADIGEGDNDDSSRRAG
jgi:hypothetical protein